MVRLYSFLIGFALLNAQDFDSHWKQWNDQLTKAAEHKDQGQIVRILEQLRSLVPGNARILQSLARALAKNGQTEAATPILAELTQAGIGQTQSVSQARLEQTLSLTDLIPEDIAYDPHARRYFISSVRKAIVLTSDGKLFARAPWSVFALAINQKRKLLWATSAFVPQCEACKKSDEGKSALIAYDLHSGEQKLYLPSPVPGPLGDITINSRGELFLSSSISAAVFRLKQGSTNFERIDTPGEFPSPQGLALSTDERTLYVADYRRGIAEIQLESKLTTWLKPGPGIIVNGIDGLYRIGQSFIAIQNGVHPPRIVQFSSDLKTQNILEANWPGLGEPNHATLLHGSLIFIANSGWPDYDDSGSRKPNTPPTTSTIHSRPLPKPAQR